MAVHRVEERLKRVTAALNAAGVPCAVVGGNAVAAWVGSVDPGATRATRNVDLLVRRLDADRVTTVLESIGFVRENLRDIVLFLLSPAANPASIWSGRPTGFAPHTP